MARKITRQRINQYAGRCAHCKQVVESHSGHLVDYENDGLMVTNRVLHDLCLPLFVQNETPERASDAWGAATSGTSAPPKRVTLEEAFVAGKDAKVFAEAEQLERELAEALQDAVAAIATQTAENWTSTVPAMVAELLAAHRPVIVTVNDLPSVKMDSVHQSFEDVLLMVVAGTSPFLVGPAGSGKTTLAEQIAKALSREFYMAARVTSEYKLVGFVDAQGKTVRTQFREAYEHGGVFLFDEVDASDPDAMTAFNAALANGYADFPDGMVHRHPDFVAIAAGNTFGRGADRQYVGRNQLDAATLDRFQVYVVDYDEALETKLAGNVPWTRYVQAIRKGVEAQKVRHVVSPRASIMGAKLLAAGMDTDKVIEACIWKGTDEATIDRVRQSDTAIGAAYHALLRHIATQTEEEAA